MTVGQAEGYAVEAAGLHATIGGSHVLQGIDLSVPAGGVTALLGRNGVGKTTTLRSLIGLVSPAGRVRILGRDVAGWPAHRIIRLGVGYVPEDRDVFAKLTVRENLRLAETGPDMDYDRVYGLFPELRQRSRQLAGTLSGGQQQMLAIGRVLLADRRVLLVDEPTKGLSPKFVSEVVDVLDRVRDTATVLMVEQNVHVVRRLAQRVIVLDHGQVVHTGEAAELADENLVRRLLGVSA
ncbi:MAG TPA: ABC transporter ATP-binding protein [Trebonia sp.]|nr:ABC transporter ATP-binding protein [Trebonia sp.]